MGVRRALALGALVLLCLGGLARGARAQATSADTAAILLDAADRMSAEGRPDAAAVILDYLRVHYAATPAGREAARRMATAPAPRAPVAIAPGVRSSSGRTELMVWGTTYGIWLGLAAPATLEASGPSPYGLGLLLGAPGGYILSRIYADRVQITEGQARAITFGGSWGTWQGYGLAKLTGVLERTHRSCVGTPEQCVESKETSAKAVLRAMVVGGLAGIGTGAALGQALDITPGQATTVNFAALWGTGYGVGAAVLFGTTGGKAPLAAAVLGGDAALLGAAAAAPAWRLSREHARLISIAGLAGALAGGGVDLLVRIDNNKVAVAIPMAGAAAGLLLGAASTRSMPAEALAPGTRGVDPADGALLGVRDGRLSLGVPALTPVLLRDRAGARATAVHVPLLSARF
jgi:hypothetical protein